MTGNHLARQQSDARQWLRYVQNRPSADLQLFCFPFAGGGAATFRKWAAKLPGNVEVYAVQLPGREDRLPEQPFRDIRPLVKTLSEIGVINSDKPFALFGHSMGALIAFELARQLRRVEARQPEHLFVSGFRAPHLPDPKPPVGGLPEAEFVEELRRLSGTPDEVLRDKDLMDFVMPTLRADFTLTENYSYVDEAPLECSISAFGGSGDPETREDEIAAWSQHTTGSFGLQMISGDHFFLLGQGQAPLLRAMSDQLKWVIEDLKRTRGT